MRCISAVAAALATVVFCALPAVSSPARAGDSPRLIKVVALSRHGVRSPTQTPETLASWGSRSWPVWDVAPGHLTKRGAALIEAEWKELRQSLAFDDLLPASECPSADSIIVYADNEERTLATARAMLQGAAPGCGMKILSRTDGTDPVFHPVRSGLMKPPACSEAERKTLANELSLLQAELGEDIARLSTVLGPASPALCASGQKLCSLSSVPTSLEFPGKDARKNVSLHGGLALASTTAEILLLESLEWPEQAQLLPKALPEARPRFPGTAVEQKTRQIMLAPRSDRPDTLPLTFAPRWKPAALSSSDGLIMVNPATMLKLLPVHTRVQNTVQRFAPVASRDGSPLLLVMAQALAGTSPLESMNRAGLVVFSGHDTNIVNLAGLLGLHWNNDPFPADSTPPGSLLVFRLWETQQGRIVQASFECQSLAALLSTDGAVMSGAALNRDDILLPGAAAETPAGPGLPLSEFLSLVRNLCKDVPAEELADTLTRNVSVTP